MARSPLDPGELGPGERLGPYRLEQRLGEGATGIVFRAVREPGGEVVALKVLRPELAGDPGYERRLLREARIAAQVRGPNLVHVFEAARSGPWLYLVAEHVAGQSLRELLDEAAQLPLDAVVRIAVGVGAALDRLHEAGLIHRDVKPSNIMVAGDQVKLADFGLARGEEHTRLTAPGQLVGTIAYAAPERLRGEEASPASDVYGLGCVVFECIAGTPPFSGSTLLEIVVGHLDDEPPDPLASRPHLPAGLRIPVRLGLAKDPGERPATAGLLARLVAEAASGQG